MQNPKSLESICLDAEPSSAEELQHLLQALPGLLAEKGIEDSMIFACLRGGLKQHELLCERWGHDTCWWSFVWLDPR